MNFLDQAIHQPLIVRLGWTLAWFLLQGAAVAVVLAIALRRMRARSARARYAVAGFAMLLLALCPVVTFAIGASRSSAITTDSIERTAASAPAAQGGDAAGAGVMSSDIDQTPPERVDKRVKVWPLVLRGTLEQLLPYLGAGWIVGVLAFSAILLAGYLRVHWLVRTASIVQMPALAQRCAELSQRLGISRSVRLLETAAFAGPAVIGILRPVIIFPAAALSGLSPQQLEAIIAHELAHIRRHDYLFNLLQSIIETLLFYHPAVWWVSSVVRRERENCCDDIAVAVLGDHVSYAEALAELAELRLATSRFVTAARTSSLLPRIRRILQAPAPQKSGGSAAGVVALAVLISCTMTGIAKARTTIPTISQNIAAMPSEYEYSNVPLPPVIPLTIPEVMRPPVIKELERWPFGIPRVDLRADFKQPLVLRCMGGGGTNARTWMIEAIPTLVQKTNYGMHVVASIRISITPDHRYTMGLDAKVRCVASQSIWAGDHIEPREAQVTWSGPFFSKVPFPFHPPSQVAHRPATAPAAAVTPSNPQKVSHLAMPKDFWLRQRARAAQQREEWRQQMRAMIEKQFPPGPERDQALQRVDRSFVEQAKRFDEFRLAEEKNDSPQKKE